MPIAAKVFAKKPWLFIKASYRAKSCVYFRLQIFNGIFSLKVVCVHHASLYEKEIFEIVTEESFDIKKGMKPHPVKAVYEYNSIFIVLVINRYGFIFL